MLRTVKSASNASPSRTTGAGPRTASGPAWCGWWPRRCRSAPRRLRHRDDAEARQRIVERDLQARAALRVEGDARPSTAAACRTARGRPSAPAAAGRHGLAAEVALADHVALGGGGAHLEPRTPSMPSSRSQKCCPQLEQALVHGGDRHLGRPAAGAPVGRRYCDATFALSRTRYVSPVRRRRAPSARSRAARTWISALPQLVARAFARSTIAVGGVTPRPGRRGRAPRARRQDVRAVAALDGTSITGERASSVTMRWAGRLRAPRSPARWPRGMACAPGTRGLARLVALFSGTRSMRSLLRRLEPPVLAAANHTLVLAVPRGAARPSPARAATSSPEAAGFTVQNSSPFASVVPVQPSRRGASP